MRLTLGQWSDQCLVYGRGLQVSFTEEEFAFGENAVTLYHRDVELA